MGLPVYRIDTNNPDPTSAINAFLWCMNKARSLGMTPPTEHILAEAMFRGSVSCMFYTSGQTGTMSLVCDEGSLTDDDSFEFMMELAKRRKLRLQERKKAEQEEREASAVQELEAAPAKDTPNDR
jgi:hypothetical protein